MKLNDVFALIQEKVREGGSGRGMSYWTAAAACGRQVVLQEAAAAAAAAVVEQPIPEAFQIGPFPGAKLDSLAVGVAYHLLHEMSVAAAPGDVWDARGPFAAEFKEALRLYAAYRKRWGSFKEKWGLTTCETEVSLPRTEAGKLAVARLYGLKAGQEVTGRMDMVGHISETARNEIRERTGLMLIDSGTYIFDLKTAARNLDDQYSDSLQAANYLAMYNAEHQSEPAVGMIFDVVTKVRVPEFYHYLTYASEVDPRRVANVVQIGAANLAAHGGRGLCNPLGCVNRYNGQACKWKKAGQCPGY